MHLAMARAATELAPASEEDAAFARGKILGAEHWILTEAPRVQRLVALCRSGEDSYARVKPHEL
jgi:butyryl-CoA dehydrogenase